MFVPQFPLVITLCDKKSQHHIAKVSTTTFMKTKGLHCVSAQTTQDMSLCVLSIRSRVLTGNLLLHAIPLSFFLSPHLSLP